MAYIADSDVNRDTLAAQFSSTFSIYHALIDDHINEIAEGEQVEESDISVDVDGYLSSKFLRRYAASWFCKELFKDKFGINNVSINDEEKYLAKYNLYNGIVESMEGKITKNMLTNTIASRMSTSTSRNMYRS